MTTVVITTQPAPAPQGFHVGSITGNKDWSNGICGCLSDLKSCSYGCCCICCMLGDIAVRQGDCRGMPFIVPSATMAMRTRIRSVGGIRGTICDDCLMAVFCFPCTVCQMSHELDTMGV